MRIFNRKSKPKQSEKTTPDAVHSSTNLDYACGPKEVQVLGHLNRFGWLTIAQLAFLLYGETPDDPRANPYRRTRKILAQLHIQKEIFIRLLPNNARAYLLTQKGANRLQNVTNIKATSGENILTTHPIFDKKTKKPRGKKSSSPSWIHRWVTNEFVIRNGIETALIEVEIYRKNAPFPKSEDRETGFLKRSRSWRGKAPDALLIREENGIQFLTWIEVENARRRTGGDLDSDETNQRGGLQSLAVWLANAFSQDVIQGKVRIDKVVFVIVTSSDTEHRLMRFMGPIIDALNTLLERWHGKDFASDQAVLFQKIEVQQYVLGKGPRLQNAKKLDKGDRPRTMLDVAEEITLLRMQPDRPALPRTDGVIKV